MSSVGKELYTPAITHMHEQDGGHEQGALKPERCTGPDHEWPVRGAWGTPYLVAFLSMPAPAHITLLYAPFAAVPRVKAKVSLAFQASLMDLSLHSKTGGFLLALDATKQLPVHLLWCFRSLGSHS